MFFRGAASALSLLASVSGVWSTILYAGVNESGGEFGAYGAKGHGLPGKFGVDYAFINETTVDIFVDKEKINLFRVSFLMERMCPPAYGLGSRFDETYFSEFADAINYITKVKGVYALLDAHNYMRYNDPSAQPSSGSIIGNTADPNAATTKQFGQFWGALAHRFADNPKVIFGLNNEPHDMPTELILLNDQTAIKAIRAAGAKQLILAPGNAYTGGHSWTQADGSGHTASSQVMYKLKDPLKNLAIDVHEYLDVDFSGSHDTCAQHGPTNLAAFTAWLKQHNLKAFLSEFGGAANNDCYQSIHELLAYVSENDEYIGWAAWAAGPLWEKNSACCGGNTGSLEPGNMASSGKPNAFSTVWPNAIRPNIPTALKRSGISTLK